MVALAVVAAAVVALMVIEAVTLARMMASASPSVVLALLPKVVRSSSSTKPHVPRLFFSNSVSMLLLEFRVLKFAIASMFR